MRRVDHQITLIRQRTKNTDYSATHGIDNQVFIEIINQAQDHLQAGIANVYSNEFILSSEISIVADQEAYTTPDRILAASKIVSVEYSSSGNLEDYVNLSSRPQRDRMTSSGAPCFYFWRSGQVYLSPIPSTSQGKIRVTYYRELDDLDTERGTINGTPATTNLPTTGMDITSQPINATNVRYLCVSDRDGNVMLRNAVVNTWASPNFTLAANVSTYLVNGYSLGDLDKGSVTFGKYTTTLSKLSDHCERYLLVATQKRIMTVDESNSSLEEDAELKQIEQGILNTYADESRDVEWIPIIDPDVMY